MHLQVTLYSQTSHKRTPSGPEKVSAYILFMAHVMHPACALRMELNKYSAGGRFNNLARILLFWMHGDRCFSFHSLVPLLILSI